MLSSATMMRNRGGQLFLLWRRFGHSESNRGPQSFGIEIGSSKTVIKFLSIMRSECKL
jgi:hypothetical protein